MESSVVLFKPRIHLFACTHLPVSNSLDCNDWLAYKHQFYSPLFKHVWIVVPCCLQASVSALCFQTCLDCGSLLRTRISIQLCV